MFPDRERNELMMVLFNKVCPVRPQPLHHTVTRTFDDPKKFQPSDP